MHPPTDFLSTAEIRKLVARGFSEMYGAELPEYNRFTAPVRASNLEGLERHPDPHVNRETLMEEKHGAIRMPGAAEMRVVTRIFAVMGMKPVEFYDMTTLGTKSLPMIATAFRATDDSIEESAFRMFCSMLHVESVPALVREEVIAELAKNRRLYPKFSAELLATLDRAEADGGLDAEEARRFAALVVDAFSMHKDKVVDFALYSKLRRISDPLADIVLESPVLNHLTPRALDIEDAVAKLNAAGIPMQTVIQGPPIREDGVSVQLNQIARIAAGEDVFVARRPEVLGAYETEPGSLREAKAGAPRVELQTGENVADYMARIDGALEGAPIAIIHHKARFGEIESRGVALTVEGEAAYNAYGIEGESDPAAKNAKVERFKQEYPKTHRELHATGWAYYTYQMTDAGRARRGRGAVGAEDLETLLDDGDVELVPQTYHDFLPFSAAAIFRANLTEGVEGTGGSDRAATDNQRLLEEAMGTAIISRHDLHRRDRDGSLREVLAELNREVAAGARYAHAGARV